MDFLKKHHEKIILAVAFLVLIGTAGYLAMKVGVLSKLVEGAMVRLPPKGEAPASTPVNQYKSAVSALEAPFTWSQPASNMFNFAPIVIVPVRTNIEVRIEAPLTLAQIQTKQFGLLFRAYSWDAETKQASNFQVSKPTERNRTFFVPKLGEPIKDPAESNRWVLAHFERKIVEVDIAGIGKQERDQSEVTLQRSGEEPVVLVLDRVSAPNPIADLRCRLHPDVPILKKKGESFECGDTAYKVVDITSTQVLLLNTKTGEQMTLPPPAP